MLEDCCHYQWFIIKQEVYNYVNELTKNDEDKEDEEFPF